MRVKHISNGSVGYFKVTLSTHDIDTDNMNLAARKLLRQKVLGVFNVKPYAREDFKRARLVVWQSGDAKMVLKDTRSEAEKGL